MMRHALPLVLLCLPAALSFLKPICSIRTPPRPSMKVNGRLWPSRRPSVLGIVGGIASGKSTVSRVLGDSCGLAVIDADKLGHESYQPGTQCFNNLVDAFGEKIVAGDGTIDRRVLGEAVFGNPSNMTKLQDIVWPEIRILAEERIKGLGDEGAESVVLEAAVLLDAGWDDMCDDLWVVQVPPDVARTRLMKRNGFSEEQADKRITSQPMTNEQRAARATTLIDNDGTEAELVEKVKQTWALRSVVLRSRRRRRSLAFLSVSAVAGAAIVTIASMVFNRGRPLR